MKISGVEVDIAHAVRAGSVAGTAFLATTLLDSKLSNHPYNDLKLVGQMFTIKSPLWQIQGLLGHYAFAITMAVVYDRYARRMLPGPLWLKGVLFMQIENNVLYVLSPLVDKVHAGEREGTLPPLMNRKTYLGQALRHVSFGAALGAMYGSKT